MCKHQPDVHVLVQCSYGKESNRDRIELFTCVNIDLITHPVHPQMLSSTYVNPFQIRQLKVGQQYWNAPTFLALPRKIEKKARIFIKPYHRHMIA